MQDKKHTFDLAISFPKEAVLILYLMTFFVAIGQNKKEQILLLTEERDSLQSLLNSERSVSDLRINELNSKIFELENQIKKLIATTKENSEKFKLLEKELAKKNELIVNLNSEIKELKDSLQIVLLSASTLPYSGDYIWELSDITWENQEFDLKLLLPSGFFGEPNNSVIQSSDKKHTIEFIYNETHWIDQKEDKEVLFFSEKDVYAHFSKGLSDIKIIENDGISFTGINLKNELVYYKGIYTDFESMQGRSSGEPKWLWSNTIILKLVSEKSESKNFNKIVNLIQSDFNESSIHYE